MNPDPYSAFNISISPCRPTSRGLLRLKSPDPTAAPEIQPAYLATDHEVAEVLAGLRSLLRLAATPTMLPLLHEDSEARPAVRPAPPRVACAPPQGRRGST